MTAMEEWCFGNTYMESGKRKSEMDLVISKTETKFLLVSDCNY